MPRQSLTKFSIRRRGNSALEIIVMLATVLFIVLIGVSALGWSMRDSLGAFAFFPESTDSTYRGASDRPSPSSQNQRTISEALQEEQAQQAFLWAGVGICVALNLLLWLLLVRRFRKASRNRSQIPDETPQHVEHSRLFEQRQQLMRLMSADMTAVFDGRLEIRHVMTKNYVTVLPNARPDAVAELIRQADSQHAVVCDSEHHLLGVVRLSELLSTSKARVDQLMHRDMLTIAANTNLIQGLTVFLRGGTGYLPVMNDQIVVGLLTTTDVVVALQSILQFLEKISTRVKPALREHSGISITEVALGQDITAATAESV